MVSRSPSSFARGGRLCWPALAAHDRRREEKRHRTSACSIENAVFKWATLAGTFGVGQSRHWTARCSERCLLRRDPSGGNGPQTGRRVGRSLELQRRLGALGAPAEADKPQPRPEGPPLATRCRPGPKGGRVGACPSRRGPALFLPADPSHGLSREETPCKRLSLSSGWETCRGGKTKQQARLRAPAAGRAGGERVAPSDGSKRRAPPPRRHRPLHLPSRPLSPPGSYPFPLSRSLPAPGRLPRPPPAAAACSRTFSGGLEGGRAGGRTASAASARVRTAAAAARLLARRPSAVPGTQQRARGAGRPPAVAPEAPWAGSARRQFRRGRWKMEGRNAAVRLENRGTEGRAGSLTVLTVRSGIWFALSPLSSPGSLGHLCLCLDVRFW